MWCFKKTVFTEKDTQNLCFSLVGVKYSWTWNVHAENCVGASQAPVRRPMSVRDGSGPPVVTGLGGVALLCLLLVDRVLIVCPCMSTVPAAA